MNFSALWGIAKVAAKAIPWGRVVQHAPDVIDYLGQAREKRGFRRNDLEARVVELQEENDKLATALVESSDQLQALSESLRTLSSRLILLGWVAAAALVIAVAALVVSLVR